MSFTIVLLRRLRAARSASVSAALFSLEKYFRCRNLEDKLASLARACESRSAPTTTLRPGPRLSHFSSFYETNGKIKKAKRICLGKQRRRLDGQDSRGKLRDRGRRRSFAGEFVHVWKLYPYTIGIFVFLFFFTEVLSYSIAETCFLTTLLSSRWLASKCHRCHYWIME